MIASFGTLGIHPRSLFIFFSEDKRDSSDEDDTSDDECQRLLFQDEEASCLTLTGPTESLKSVKSRKAAPQLGSMVSLILQSKAALKLIILQQSDIHTALALLLRTSQNAHSIAIAKRP
jgi:hypothetical protein